MTKPVRALLSPLILFAFIFLVVGCNKGTDTGPVVGPGPDQGGPGGSQSSIKQIMKKVNGGGPQSLHSRLGGELKAESPAWETIQPQTKEYAELAASLGKNNPPKGSKESWQTLSEAYAAAAADLDKAAQAKDVAAAKTAHDKLNKSCMGCHKEHQQRGGGRGGM